MLTMFLTALAAAIIAIYAGAVASYTIAWWLHPLREYHDTPMELLLNQQAHITILVVIAVCWLITVFVS